MVALVLIFTALPGYSGTPTLAELGANKDVPLKASRMDGQGITFRVMEKAEIDAAYIVGDIPEQSDFEGDRLSPLHARRSNHIFKQFIHTAIARSFPLVLRWDAHGVITEITMHVPTYERTFEEMDAVGSVIDPQKNLHLCALIWRREKNLEAYFSSTPWEPVPSSIARLEQAAAVVLRDQLDLTLGRVQPKAQSVYRLAVPFEHSDVALPGVTSQVSPISALAADDLFTAFTQQTPVHIVKGVSTTRAQFYHRNCAPEVVGYGMMAGKGSAILDGVRTPGVSAGTFP